MRQTNASERSFQTRPARNRAELDALEMKRSELRRQLESNTERRSLLAVQRREAQGTASQPEIDARIKALDARSARIDQELNAIDDAVAASLAGGITVDRGRQTISIQPPPMVRMDRGFGGRTVMGPLMAFNATGFVLLGLFLWRTMRRRVGGPARLAPDEAARIEQLQRSVDVIALEVERISEGQRFVTKILNERAPALPSRGAGES